MNMGSESTDEYINTLILAQFDINGTYYSCYTQFHNAYLYML